MMMMGLERDVSKADIPAYQCKVITSNSNEESTFKINVRFLALSLVMSLEYCGY